MLISPSFLKSLSTLLLRKMSHVTSASPAVLSSIPLTRTVSSDMASNSKPSNAPLVVVCGATGTGKSKLGIQLAQKFGGEVINADSIQLYKGLDIVTNKVTDEEMCGVPHHLLGVIDPRESGNSIHNFRSMAEPIIHRLRDAGRLPVIVGGTFYYLESLLWDFLIEVPASTPQRDSDYTSTSTSESLTNQDLHNQLAKLDPQTAARLHPNNRRKVERALEIIQHSEGISLTDRLANQHGQNIALASRDSEDTNSSSASVSKAGPPRYPLGDVLLIYLSCDPVVLDTRLDSRVYSMLDAGLLDEVEEFLASFSGDSSTPEFTKGVLQSIGVREFHPYFQMSQTDRATKSGTDLLADCIDRLKVSNRQYARRQIQWMTNRFLRRPPSEYIPLFNLDTSDPSRWDEMVLNPAVMILEDTLSLHGDLHTRRIKPETPLPPIQAGHPSEPLMCSVCNNQVFVNEQQWQIHLKSRRHQKRVRGLRKRAQMATDDRDSFPLTKVNCLGD